jgi:hypothetical protein
LILLYAQLSAMVSSPLTNCAPSPCVRLEWPKMPANGLAKDPACRSSFTLQLRGGQDPVENLESAFPAPIMRTANMTREDLRRIGLEMAQKQTTGQPLEEKNARAQAAHTNHGHAGVSFVGKRGAQYQRRRVTSEVMDAMHTFAWMPLCPQTRKAFMLQVPVKEMVDLLSMPVEAVECDHEESVFVIALRCLSKICSGSKTTEGMERVLTKLGVTLENLGPAFSNCLQTNDTEVRSGALSVIGLFTDERGGEFIQAHGLHIEVVKLLGHSIPQVVSAATEAMHKLVRSDSGLAALFSGESLAMLEGWLENGVEGLGMRVAQVSTSHMHISVGTWLESV